MTEKTLDAVRLMRELRDKLSQEMEHMAPEERIRYIRDRAASTSLGRKVAESATDAAHQADVADRPPACD